MFRERVRRVILPPSQENIDKLEKVIKEGNYYGAQQMYKSTSARYASAERYSDALNVLQSGACLQLDKARLCYVMFVFSSTCTINFDYNHLPKQDSSFRVSSVRRKMFSRKISNFLCLIDYLWGRAFFTVC
ncbi:protein GET4-like [Lycium ferocissimum]|uniref:protein GET4-like n=1 Tax=Lycium ferocissimum TaxID=112874 RepID=UPI002814C062|nr:protein GET4-like [Lycium ferocissimum]